MDIVTCLCSSSNTFQKDCTLFCWESLSMQKHPGGPGTGPWLLKNSCFAVAPARFHVGNNHEKKTSVLVWFATLTGFCASKPGERSKWSFLFTAWEILQLRQWRSASRSQCVPISIGDFECIWTTNHCVCLGLGNECCLELTFSSIISSLAYRSLPSCVA